MIVIVSPTARRIDWQTPTEQVGPCREGRRKSGSHLTPCWREQDSNPRSPDLGELSCRAHYADRPEGARASPKGSLRDSPRELADVRVVAASHSMEPGADRDWAGCGLGRCSASSCSALLPIQRIDPCGTA